MRRQDLELVHFQLTRNCNLRCWFCGQWGKKGFFREGSGVPMEYEDWLALGSELATLPQKPDIILWGGEPLMYPRFDELAGQLHAMGFRLGIVTNGTLINRHVEVLRAFFARIYVSLDGPEALHDSIRGQGVFRKVAENLLLLRGGNAKIAINTVLTPALLENLDGALDAFAPLGPDEVLLQEMIGLSAGEVECYRRWLQENFAQEAKEIASWEGGGQWNPKAEEIIAETVKKRRDLFQVAYLPHGAACGKHCGAPRHHAHVTWKGSVCFCTDFYDFSAGNVREKPLLDILEGENAEVFRRETENGGCPTCDHCSWRGSESFRL